MSRRILFQQVFVPESFSAGFPLVKDWRASSVSNVQVCVCIVGQYTHTTAVRLKCVRMQVIPEPAIQTKDKMVRVPLCLLLIFAVFSCVT